MLKMKTGVLFLLLIFCWGCTHNGFQECISSDSRAINVLFLHHSIGEIVYNGLGNGTSAEVAQWFNRYNQDHRVPIHFVDQVFPKAKRFKYFGYGWSNSSYDYHQIWVGNGQSASYKNEPTLQALTPFWDVIVWKHCFPVSSVSCTQTGNGDLAVKTIENYTAQYLALRDRMHEFPNTLFVVWTGAALTQASTAEESAQCSRHFFDWVKNSWDLPDDNIFIWDFYELETEGGIYLKEEFAQSKTDSHPNKEFASRVAGLMAQRVADVIENKGKNTDLKGNYLSQPVQ